MASGPGSTETSSLPHPPAWWRFLQSLRGCNFSRLTAQDVPRRDLTGKWIIITGANNGVGYEAAKTFAEWGSNLVLACREPPRWETDPRLVVEECRELSKAGGHLSEIEWWEIDLAHLSSVEAFARRWLDTGRGLDILCNNAGTASSPTGRAYVTQDGFDFIHQVNFLSHVMLTLRLLPSLARSAEARIICTTSCFQFISAFDLDHFNGEPGMKGTPYGNNKLYFQAWLTELQSRLLRQPEYRHITINGVHPGYVNSGIWDSVPAKTLEARVLKFLAHNLAITSQQGSLAIVHAATSDAFGPGPAAQPARPGSGGGNYINRIWCAEPMPQCNHQGSRLQVWARVDEELRLEEKGLLQLL